MNANDIVHNERIADQRMAARGVPLADFEDANGQLPEERKRDLDEALYWLTVRARSRCDGHKPVWSVQDVGAVETLGRLMR